MMDEGYFSSDRYHGRHPSTLNLHIEKSTIPGLSGREMDEVYSDNVHGHSRHPSTLNPHIKKNTTFYQTQSASNLVDEECFDSVLNRDQHLSIQSRHIEKSTIRCQLEQLQLLCCMTYVEQVC